MPLWRPDITHLQYRKHGVNHNVFPSPLKYITSGVPQVGIVETLLFIICLNDVFRLQSLAELKAYDDDLALFFGTDIGDIRHSASVLWRSLWTEQNSLKINASKTRAVIF